MALSEEAPSGGSAPEKSALRRKNGVPPVFCRLRMARACSSSGVPGTLGAPAGAQAKALFFPSVTIRRDGTDAPSSRISTATRGRSDR